MASPPAPVAPEPAPVAAADVERQTTPPAPPAAPLTPEPAPADSLIELSHAVYQSGVAAYRAGHLERARREFDRAIDIFLSAKPELRENPRVEQHLETLVDEIHAFEVVALKEGDGFAESGSVPAPVDEIAEVTFPTDPKLKERVEREVKDIPSELPLVLNDHVLGYIQYFTTRGRLTMETGLRRAGRYRDMISRVLAEEGVPQEMIYLAQAESAFHPWALSRASARGMWQFMAGTAREYGLKIDWWADERQDPEKATRAAARHLKDLYNTFGDWYLAMAAYNSGAGAVHRAVRRTGYANFWELYARNALPRETRNYVPIILAATVVGKNLKQYGFSEVLPDPSVQTEAVTISSPTDLRLIAETIDCSVDFLRTLNPSLLRTITPKEDFELKLPAGTKDRFMERIALIPEDKRVFWRWHNVRLGEGLDQIASEYGTTAKAIAEVNGLPGGEVAEGLKLVIPVSTTRDGGKTAYGKAVRLRYRVRRGDTVSRVADRFGVTPSELRSWNRIRGNRIRAGQLLTIHTLVNSPEAASSSSGSRRKAASPKAAAVSPPRASSLDASSLAPEDQRRTAMRISEPIVPANNPADGAVSRAEAP